ncbi:MAG TPA: ABC transporter substrate-binding protein, partial [Lachnospiraceae bacterium]|nr:ABC transporter substrate-binding protein [Lachnospiraceae bacterium]
MEIKKTGALILTVSLAAGALAGCGGSKGQESSSALSGVGGGSANGGSDTVTLWATGSDNVRQIYEKLIDDFNNNSEYAGKYNVKLQFMLSGTGAQSMTDMLNAAYQAKQTDTDYDLVDFSGDDLSKMVSLIGEDSFVELDETKIPNRANILAESSVAGDHTQAYRGTTVILAYDSATVPEPPQTMDELVQWMKDNPGRFAYNTPGTGGAGDSFARTSVYNFMDEEAITSDDPKWMDEWDEGFGFLQDLHQYMYASGGSIVYPNKNQGTLDLLNQGEID